MIDALAETFRRELAREHCRIASAPGRVNLIGEHTDYNDGFVLPVAIDRHVMVAFAPNEGSVLRGCSIDFDERRVAAYDDLKPCSGPPTWFDYAAGVAWALRRQGETIPGLDFAVAGDIPIGAGLSSSAALELAMARALFDAADVSWDGRRAARIGQLVENDYIGLESGIMDQMVSALSEEGSAMLLDCRDLSFETVGLPQELAVVVMDTGTRRTLATSAYNDRRKSCEKAANVLLAKALRDVNVEELKASRAKMDDVTYRRALHVIEENQRTLEMADALRSRDMTQIGRLMAGSHKSLRDLYEVSSPALDRIVALAVAHDSCVGARMTGAGFGGCAVAIVKSDGLEDFLNDVRPRDGGALYPCRTVAGATILSPREK